MNKKRRSARLGQAVVAALHERSAGAFTAVGTATIASDDAGTEAAAQDEEDEHGHQCSGSQDQAAAISRQAFLLRLGGTLWGGLRRGRAHKTSIVCRPR